MKKVYKKIGGVGVVSNLFLGAGVIKTTHNKEITGYLSQDSIVGALTIGSLTRSQRAGNVGSLNWPRVSGGFKTYLKDGGLHANGMKNMGIKETMDTLPTNSRIPLAVSLAGYSVEDYIFGLREILNHKNISLLSAIEINCSCPTMGRSPMAYSLETLSELFLEIKKIKSSKPLWFKLSPYFTEETISDMQKKYSEYDFSKSPIISCLFLVDLCNLLKENEGIISAIIVSNGLPGVSRGHEIRVNKDSGVIENSAGLSGKLLKENNLATIRLLRSRGVVSDVIGCGGVLSKSDLDDYLEAGAQAVQSVGGPVWGDGPLFLKTLIN